MRIIFCSIFFLVISSVSFAQDTIHDANTLRLFVTPTARSLPEDNGYINLAEIIMPNFGYGITDEIMVRGGFTPFTVSDRILYFALASIQVAHYGDLTISGGVTLTDITGSTRNWESAIYGYGVVSYGNDDDAMHAGFGGGYSANRESNSAIFMIGGELKVANTTKIISENWIVSETGSGAYAIGLRIFGRSLTGELGAVMMTTDNNSKISSILPWIGITFIL